MLVVNQMNSYSWAESDARLQPEWFLLVTGMQWFSVMDLDKANASLPARAQKEKKVFFFGGGRGFE